MKKMFLVYGVPGAGKTTFVKNELIPKYDDLRHYEADMFFMKNGKYDFNPKQLFLAHKWCQKKAEEAMIDGATLAISNTSVTPRDRRFYLEIAKKYGYVVIPHFLYGGFKSVHGVSEASMKKFAGRLKFVTADEIQNA